MDNETLEQVFRAKYIVYNFAYGPSKLPWSIKTKPNGYRAARHWDNEGPNATKNNRRVSETK